MAKKEKQRNKRSKMGTGWLWTLGLLALILGAGGLIRTTLRVPTAAIESLPNPDLSSMERQVAQKLNSLRQRVLQDLQSGLTWGRLAMNYDVHGLKQEAISAYEQAVELDPSEFRWPYYLGILLEELGSEESLRWFEMSRKIWPTYGPLLVRTGRAEFRIGNLEEAAVNFGNALDVDRQMVAPYLGLAQIRLAQGNAAGAEALLEQVLQIAPYFGTPHSLMAEVYRRVGRSEDAERERRIASQFPNDVPVADLVHTELMNEGVSARWYQVRGQAFMNRGMTDSATILLRRSIDARPTPNAHNSLGIAFQLLGLFNAAEEQHLAALAIRPNFAEAYVNLSSVFASTGRLDEAISSLEQAREIDPTLIQVYVNLAIYHTRLGRRNLAIVALREGLEIAPYELRLNSRLAWLLATSIEPELRNGEESVRLAETVRDITGDEVPQTLDILAAAYAETGDFAAAVEIARRAGELAVSNGQPEFAERISGRVGLYEANRPYRTSVVDGG